jgi:hypothetical protein
VAAGLLHAFDFPGYVALKVMNFQSRFRIILVSSLNPEGVSSLGFEPADSIDSAMALARASHPRPKSVILMPVAAATVPVEASRLGSHNAKGIQ